MAKIHPQSLIPSSSSSSSSSSCATTSCSRERFTLWMRSLVMNGNGCTVYDSYGQLAYRVDNYAYKCSNEVYLMDHKGRTLTKILKKKMSLFGQWNGYRCNGSTSEEERPTFKVRKARRIIKTRGRPYEHKVNVGYESADVSCYKVVGLARKSGYKIMDVDRGLVAEVKRKHTSAGIALGDDIFTLVVEPNVDHLLIMGIVVVCGLIDKRI